MAHYLYTPVFLMVLVPFIVWVQSKPQLTILNGTNTLACGSRTVLTCKVVSEHFLQMYWYVDGTMVGECNDAQCMPTKSLPDNYRLSMDIETKTRRNFFLEINPIKIDDTKDFFCTCGDSSDSLTTHPENKIGTGKFSITHEAVGLDANFELISNCMEQANELNFKLYIEQGSQLPSSDVIKSTTLYINCTNQENPNCGGNTTNRALHKIKIPTDSEGDLFKLYLNVSHKSDYILYYIGSYHIKNPASTTHAPSSPRPPCDYTSGYVMITVAGIFVCMFTYSWCKGHRNCLTRACSCIRSVVLSIVRRFCQGLYIGNIRE